MAGFNWVSLTIDMSCGMTRFSRPELENMPHAGAATMSFVHEYVHYAQSIGSVAGCRLLAEWIDIGVAAALILEGHITEADFEGKSFHRLRDSFIPIFEILSRQPDGAARELPLLLERRKAILSEGALVFMTQSASYGGRGAAFDVVEEEYRGRRYYGYITPRRIFVPFNVGFLAENMARAIDQRLNAAHQFGHAWAAGPAEEEIYRGLQHVLEQSRYERNVAPRYVNDVVILVCALSLACERPDEAAALLLHRLATPRQLGGLPQAIAPGLQAHLGGHLSAGAYNAAVEIIQHGLARSMARQEYYEIYELLKCLQRIGNTMLHDPMFFLGQDTTWDRVVCWMTSFGLPQVKATDGTLRRIGATACCDYPSMLLEHAFRVLS